MRFFVTFFAVIAACACTPLTGFCQTNFKNLAFEEGSLVYDPYPWINPTLALPNWNVDVGVTYNVRGLGLQLIDFYDSTNLDLFPVLSGRFSVYLQPSTPNPEHLPSISQMGTIPDGTKSLLFLSWRPELSVTFAGHPLELVTLSSKPSRTVMGANISQYSGQTGELKFTGGGALDLISFSTQEIPEPSSAVLIIVAIGMYFLRRKSGRKCVREEYGFGFKS